MCKFSSKSGGVPFQISFFLGDLTRNDDPGTKSGRTLLILALEQKLKEHWNGLQMTFLLSYCTSKSEQAENSLVLPNNYNNMNSTWCQSSAPQVNSFAMVH